MVLAVDHSPKGEPFDENVAGIAVDALMVVVDREFPCQTEQRNNYACHRTGANMVRCDPYAHGCGLYYDGCMDDDSKMHHLECCGLATCEDAGVTLHDRRPVVASCAHDASSPAA